MSGLTFFYAWLGMTCSLSVLVILIMGLGHPPRHCRYLVQVKNTPGVYACSQLPKVKARP
jgi:hypothetical protein